MKYTETCGCGASLVLEVGPESTFLGERDRQRRQVQHAVDNFRQFHTGCVKRRDASVVSTGVGGGAGTSFGVVAGSNGAAGNSAGGRRAGMTVEPGATYAVRFDGSEPLRKAESDG